MTAKDAILVTQIRVVSSEVIDQEVVDLIEQMDALVSQLNTSRGETHRKTGSRICRFSRRIIWAFVSSDSCSLKQVESARVSMELAAQNIVPENSDDSELVEKFRAAVVERGVILGTVLESVYGSPSEQTSNRKATRRPTPK